MSGLRRDTFRDFLTGFDMMDAGSEQSARQLEAGLIDRLWRRSGAINVANARLRKDLPLHVDAVLYRISFDSSAWTGRP